MADDAKGDVAMGAEESRGKGFPEEDLYERILSHFPAEQISFSCAYGSGVFQQANFDDKSNNVIDFIFVVRNTRQWHRQNVQLNAGHYSWLRLLGPGVLRTVQKRMGAGIYYNPPVECGGRKIKYGVISEEEFLDDLVDWNSLYVSGRLHKPVRLVLPHKPSEEITTALEQNLTNAMRTSLLLLPAKFTELQLYTMITSLSYRGDFRMGIAEDKNKVTNIVQANMGHFERLYHPMLRSSHPISKYLYLKGNGSFQQVFSTEARLEHLCALPHTLKTKVIKQVESGWKKDSSADMEEAMLSTVADDPRRCKVVVRKGIASIVRRSSITQTAKGVISAGVWRSCLYAGQKVHKMVRGMAK